ncbi:MAG TPA: tRNA lysidine(34) synthetase TilS [Desulfobacteraceae bacterium]|nr:tRNA lysidine(34) synthetase TilS [Desulfobacteraceae bacterium]HPJ67488.1 tRNA lysidine(34) synthetase TilS [Desulfobacteraceae bacterium]
MDLVIKTIRRVRNTILKHKMLDRGDSVIVAVSGGPDSVCLLDILSELKSYFNVELTVAHFDHGLRPGEDEAETLLVQSLARSLNLTFETAMASMESGISGASLEEKARDARYLYLEQLRLKLSADKIAVGHNMNDQAETVLMRLLRGSGLSGLSGIPPFREGIVIRPLIELTRGEIESFLKQRGLRYAIDSSNLKNNHLRNRIRNELIPSLSKYQPRIVEVLGQTAEIIKREDEFMESAADEWVRINANADESRGINISSSSLSGIAPALGNRIVRCLLRAAGGGLRRISYSHIEAINRLIAATDPHARIDLPGRLSVRRIYDRVYFSRDGEKRPEGFMYILDGPGSFYLDAIGKRVTLEEIDGSIPVDMKSSAWTAFLNADRIAYPLIIRNVKEGDRFVPLGMKGHKKLKDFFIDRKIPFETRIQIPILVCRDHPVWVCGMRIDDRFKVTAGTGKILKITLTGL